MLLPSPSPVVRLATALVGVAVTAACAGRNAVEAPTSARPTSTLPAYTLAIDLDPPTHGLRGRATILLPTAAEEVSFRLHEDATVSAINAGGAKVKGVRKTLPESETDKHATYTVSLSSVSPRPELIVSWEGTLYQDPSVGERAGVIHNQTVRATIGDEGVYLTGAWYPQLIGSEVGTYELSLGKPEKLVLVASGERDDAASKTTGRDVWYSPYPLQELVVVGGPHEVYTDEWRGLKIAVHLKPSQAQHAEGLKKAVRGYLDRYEPLLGPLPTKQYRVVDNFFSSGFAFPGFTLLSSSVIEMGEISQTHHGYIDHEFVHTWFGAGVHTGENQGNWSEALTSYATNYYGYILDGDEVGARKYRRDATNSFSKLPPDQDVPFSRFGVDRGTSRLIGYNKGAVIFHILAQEIGQETFWAAIRNFNYRNVGRVATFADLQTAFEEASGRDLDWFFAQWVDGTGAVEARIANAEWNAAAKELRLTLEKPSNFRVKLPIDLKTGAGRRSISHDLAVGDSSIVLTGIETKPESVALDPDFHVLHRLKPSEFVPTIDATRRATRILALADDSAASAPFFELFQQESAPGQFRQGVTITKTEFIKVPDLNRIDTDWSQSAVVIVGDAVKTPAAQAILASLDSPLRILPNGFSVGGTEYTKPEHAVSATYRHPSLPGSGVTIIYGNSPESLPKATNLPFFPNSIIVFEKGRSKVKQDLEFDPYVPVRPTP